MTHYHALEKFEKVMSVLCVVLLLIYPSVSFHTEQVVTAQSHDSVTIASADITNTTQIIGRGFGNNGNSFSAFIECSDGKYFSFDKGSLISLGQPSMTNIMMIMQLESGK